MFDGAEGSERSGFGARLEEEETAATHLHRVQLTQRGLSHRHLNGRDPEAPDIGLGVVAALLDDLGRHPVGRSDEGVLLGHGGGKLTRDSEIGELDYGEQERSARREGEGRGERTISVGAKEDVGGCDREQRSARRTPGTLGTSTHP